MGYKIAVGSSDGQEIDQHFASSEQFLIYAVSDDGEWLLQETRINETSGIMGQHQENQLQKTISLLHDCNKVLISRIGPGAEQALKSAGISAYSVTGPIDEALEKLIGFRQNFRNRLKKRSE